MSPNQPWQAAWEWWPVRARAACRPRRLGEWEVSHTGGGPTALPGQKRPANSPRGWSSGQACCPRSRWNCSPSPSRTPSWSPSRWRSCSRCCCCRCCCPCSRARRPCSRPAGVRRCPPARREREGKPSEQTPHICQPSPGQSRQSHRQGHSGLLLKTMEAQK